ncbi:unnamed protein product, partial [Rotaria magnacalcarata]
SGDEKRTDMSPSKLTPDAGNDTDIDNQEVANVARRPSRAMSPLNRPRSPTPNDSRKASINMESAPSAHATQLQSPTDDDTNHSAVDHDHTISPTVNNNHRSSSPGGSNNNNQEDDDEQKQTVEAPATFVSSASRRESTNQDDQQQTLRPTSALKTKSDDNSLEPSTSRPGSSRLHNLIATDERLKLVKSDEQLQIPTDEFANEQTHSPPQSPIDTQPMISADHSLDSNIAQNEQNRSRPTSAGNRKSPTKSMLSNEKGIDGEVPPLDDSTYHDIHQQQTHATDDKPASRRESQVVEKTEHISGSRRASASQQPEEFDNHREPSIASRRTSNEVQESTSHNGFVSEQQNNSRRESINLEQKPSSRKPSVTSVEQAPTPSNSDIVSREQQNSSREKSSTDTRKTLSRQSSTTFQQQPISQRETLSAEHEKFTHRNSHVSEHHTSDHHERKLSNGSVARKPSATEREHASRRASEQKEIAPSSRRASEQEEIAPSSRRASTNRDKHVASPRHSDVDNSSAPRASSHRSSLSKQDNQPISAHVRKGSHPTSIHSQDINHRQINNEPNLLHRDLSSPETDSPNRTTAKQQRERVPVNEKRQKSSSSVDDSDHHRATTIPRHSGQQSKRNSNKTTDETVVTPIIMDSSTVRQHSGNRGFKGDSDNEYAPKLPPVNKSLQNKAPHSETVNRQKIPLSNRSETRPVSSSRSSTISDNGQKPNWLKQIPIPSIHFSDNETSLTIDQGLRPQSPNVEQIAERNKLITPPPPTTKTLAGKKRIVTEGTRRKQQGHLSRRSSSAESGAIRMVDDDSLDSSSENNSNFETQRRRHNKLKKRDVETNTEDIYDIEQHKTQRSFFDEREKNIQTLKSQLRPRKKSPKKNYPLYLSTDSFRVEELLPKSFHQSRKTISKSSALARSLSPQGGKLLILRPTLPFHHTDAVNVQRVCLQYAIDLIPNDNASHVPMSANRNKSNVLKNPEQTNILPMISASTSGLHHMSSNKSAKSTSNKSEELTHQRKNGGGV